MPEYLCVRDARRPAQAPKTDVAEFSSAALDGDRAGTSPCAKGAR